jgi:hypothetical protein
MKTWIKVVVICIVVLVASDSALAGKFRAYYTKIDSGQAFEKYSRTGPYADIVVELGQGKFVFWRGSSYLPYWETGEGKWFVDEVIPRSGDGPRQRPDKVNTYSRVARERTGKGRCVVAISAAVWWEESAYRCGCDEICG